ncbi:hypothetical protein PQX77_019356 [Marasmius sp. AFHP31]|nr:hypothetical protein PQX77_019356 [Marasmius sp. AFHP31]
MSRITLGLKRFSRADEHTSESGTLSWAVASRSIPRFVMRGGRSAGGGSDTRELGRTMMGEMASKRGGVPDTGITSATTVADAGAMGLMTTTIGHGKAHSEEGEYKERAGGDEDTY